MDYNNSEIANSKLEDILKVAPEKAEATDLSEEKSYDDPSGENGRECFNYREDILKSALDISNEINTKMLQEERGKTSARTKTMLFLQNILWFSVITIILIIICSGLNIIEISDTVIIGLLTYIIVNIFVLMKILVDYISTNKLLDTFGAVTQKLLDFLINDKKSD